MSTVRFRTVLISCIPIFGMGLFSYANLGDGPPTRGPTHFRELAVVYGPPEKPEEPKPFIGIMMEPVPTKDVRVVGGPEKCAGVRLIEVIKGSAAEEAGLEKGDIVFASKSEDGKKLFVPQGDDYEPVSEIVGLLEGKRPGDGIILCALRGGEEMEFAITLGEREVAQMPAAEHPEFRPTGGGPSRLEKFLKDNNLFNSYVETAHMLYGASNMLQGSTHIVQDKPDFFRLREITYLLRHPENTALLSDEIADSLEEHFNAKTRDIPALISTAARWLDEEPQGIIRPEFKGNTDDIGRLTRFVEGLMRLRAGALRELNEEEIEFTYARLSKIYGPDDMTPEEFLKLLRIIARVDFEKLFASCAMFAQLTSVENLALLKEGAAAHMEMDHEALLDGFEGDVLATFKTEIGNIVIGGEGPTTYRGPAAIIIDLGGDDYYAAGVAGSRARSPFALCVDFAGDDVYAGGSLNQGTGILGAGILLDVEGSDTYRSSRLCQGCALLGAGILADLSGDDVYRASQSGQGYALFGIGALLDGGGEDSYSAGSLAQGVGLTKGLGALIEVSGNDSYYAGGKEPDYRDPERSCGSMSQGFGSGWRPSGENAVGMSGGIGLLADASGHDRYTGDYFGQGASYWFALGILRDSEGHDRYFAGRYSQGAGVHLSLGALIDCGGHDSYVAYFGVSQGCGHDMAYGILEDRAGNDHYQSGVVSMGVGNDNGIGVLFDHKGDDSYVVRGRSLGQGNYQQSRKAGSVGVFLDLGGCDKYIDRENDEPADGKAIARKDRHIGIFIDVP